MTVLGTVQNIPQTPPLLVSEAFLFSEVPNSGKNPKIPLTEQLRIISVFYL